MESDPAPVDGARSAGAEVADALKTRLVYLQYRAGAALGARVPLPVGEGITRILGRITSRTMRRHRRLVELHQRRVGDARNRRELDRQIRQVFQGYARYWYELFRMPAMTRGTLEPLMTTVGLDHVERGLAAGKGVIAALPHLGSFDFAGGWLAERGIAPVAVAETVEPPELFEWFVRQREALGITVIPLGPDAGTEVAKALRANRVACLLCDRDLTGDGAEVEFFGEKTTMPAGPAMLALRTGAPLLPVGLYFRPGGMHWGVVQPPVPAERVGRLRDDIARITQELAYRFEQLIRAEPEQWLMMQPNWPSDGEAP